MFGHVRHFRALAALTTALSITAGLLAQQAAAEPGSGERPAPTIARLPDIVYDAHRGGAMEARENSLSAFRSALDSGVVQVLDVDTRMLSDGTVVVHHDRTLDRETTSTGRVARLTLDAWRNVIRDLGSWLRPVPPPERAVTLAKVLNRFGGDIVLSIEAKDADSTETIAEMIKSRGLVSSAYLNTNDPAVARRIDQLGLRAHLWRSARQMETDDPSDFTPFVDLLDVDITATNADIRKFVDSGVAPVWVHTLTTRAQRDRALRLGATGIVTDNPRYVTGRTDTYPMPPTLLVVREAPEPTQISDDARLSVHVRTVAGPGNPEASVEIAGRGVRGRILDTDRNGVSTIRLLTRRAEAGNGAIRLEVARGRGEERRWTSGATTVPLRLTKEDLKVRPALRQRGDELRLRVRLLDSAATGYDGPRRETGARQTVAGLDRAVLRVRVLRSGEVVHRATLRGADTGPRGDGVGKAVLRWTAPRAGRYEVRVHQRGPVYLTSRHTREVTVPR